MKHPYRIILSTVAITSALAVAQAPAPAAQEPAAPAPETQAAPAEAAPAPAEAAPQTAAPEQPVAAQPATAQSVQPAPAATEQPAKQAEAQPAPQPAAAQPAAEAAPATTPEQPANQAEAQPAPQPAPVAEQQPQAEQPATAPAEQASAQAATEQAPAEQAAAPEAVAASEAAAPAGVAEVPAEPAPVLLSGTEIGGAVHGMLTADKSPYLVTSDLTVEGDKALFIQAGVTLLFKPGTGFYVNSGSLTIAGNQAAPVVFRSAQEPATAGSWKGIFLTGEKEFYMFGASISDAEVGIAIEKGSLSLQASKISNTTSRGVYVRDAKASIMSTEFSQNKGVALHAANYADIYADRNNFHDNRFALLNSELANTVIHSSEIKSNEYGVVGKENNQFLFHNTNVDSNKVGAAGIDIMDESVIASVKGNEKDFGSASIALLATLPANPEVPGVESRPFKPSDRIGVLNREARESIVPKDSTKAWTVLGNVMLGGNYHYVRTRTNRNGEQIVGNDTIADGRRFKNLFQVPGFGAELAAYLYMQSADGKTIEFNTDITTDSWNHFSPNPVTLTYTDAMNRVVLGDQEKTGGELYMAGMPLFGIDYTLSLLRNNADKPLFEANGFFGEAKRSMVPGDRHPFIYKDYIEDGSAQAQRMAYGGSFKWAPVRRFDAKVGAIYANDELKDPLLRDGASTRYTTADPMISSLTMFAEGNWLFFPGDIELNGQIAVGRADTTDVIRERAINKVFSEAGLNVSSFSKMRSLMQNTDRINSLSHDELVEIFGEGPALRDTEMRDSLRTLIRSAKHVQKDTEKDRDDGRFIGENWGSQNIALSGTLNWNIHNTHISGGIKYIGEDFYSAGSDNQISDFRQFNARLEQDVFNFWTFAVSYELNVENAANGSKTNLFGLSEGTRWGIFSDASSGWFNEHELDYDRTKYTQNMGMEHKFDINKNIVATAGYNFQYQKQYRPYRLYGDFKLEDGIYNDEWFSKRDGHATTTVIYEDNAVLVDSARWEHYNSLYNAPYLASRFQEKIFKHTFNAGVSVKAFHTTFKMDGFWTIRAEGSQFLKDSLIEDYDLHDTTWAKLGYYFGGSNYFEHRYPMSATTSFKNIQNRISITPRFKSYKRDDMEESEITISDEFEIPFRKNFFILGLNGEFRYMTTSWEEHSEDFDESETDLLGDVSLRVNHTKHFYSVWSLGAASYMRPDDLSSEYRDFFGGVQLNYVF